MDFVGAIWWTMCWLLSWDLCLRVHCLTFKHSSEDFCKSFLWNELKTQVFRACIWWTPSITGLKTLVEEYTLENRGCEHNFNLSYLCQFWAQSWEILPIFLANELKIQNTGDAFPSPCLPFGLKFCDFCECLHKRHAVKRELVEMYHMRIY